MRFPSNVTFRQARSIFNSAMRKAEDGVQVLYSCSVNEESIITPEGSHYTKSLLTSIRTWSKQIERNNVLSGIGAHRYSTINIKNYNRQQNPRTTRNKPNVNYPFAIRLGAESFYY